MKSSDAQFDACFERPAVRGDVAIIGVACTYPKARTAAAFWQNIVRGVDAIDEVSPKRWDPAVFYDPNPAAEDRVYCKRGGYLDNSFSFNPLKYGTMPRAIQGAEPDQFLVLRTVHEALDDAGYLAKPLDGRRCGFILGRGNYLGVGLTSLLQRGMMSEQTLQILRALHPEYTDAQLAEVKRAMRAHVPQFTSETAPGLIPNITTGRVANRLDLMGPTFTVDAACASSLIATDLGVHDLLTGKHDVVLAGGVHIFSDVPFLQVFAAMGALSRTSTIRPFDRDCDGTMAGEGVGILVLKRLADAERDGDRIYALIKGIGTSSDGRAKSVTAPRVEGEELALRRAYAMAGVDPTSIGLIEAHGTGTPVGDETEVEALHRVLGPRRTGPRTVALGSVKSMIGHCMPAAGAAGLIKTAFALYHGVLPPTLNCRRPVEAIDSSESLLYVNAATRPWVHGRSGAPRRAGVSAFGFGGVNAHVVLEEYGGPRRTAVSVPSTVPPESPVLHAERPSELIIIEAADRAALIEACIALSSYLAAVEGVTLAEMAAWRTGTLGGGASRIAFVATSSTDLRDKLDRAVARLRDADCKRIQDSKGIYYLSETELRGGKLAFLFPGEGAQYPNMLADLCVHFPSVRARFDSADRAVLDTDRDPPSADLFPAPLAPPDEQAAAESRLWQIERAVEAVLTADGAMFELLNKLGLKADMIAGHSGGEWIASVAAGVFDVDDFVASMPRLDRMYRDLNADATIPQMVMLAVGTSRAEVERIAGELHRPVHIANDNCRHQVVVVTAPQDAEAVTAQLKARQIFVERLPYDRGYHTPAFSAICAPLRGYFSSLALSSPTTMLYSCTSATPYPADPAAILDVLTHTFVKPVLFRETVDAMYAAGARLFVEVGPRANLTAFTDDILRGKPHLAVATNHHRRDGVTTLHHALAIAAALHVPMTLSVLYGHRGIRRLTGNAAKDTVVAEAREPGTVQVTLCYPHLELPAGFQAPLQQPRDNGGGGPPVPPRPAPAAKPSAPAASPERFTQLAAAAPALAAVRPIRPVRRVGPRRAGPATHALMSHMSVMEQALAAQQEVLLGYLSGGRSAARAAPLAPVMPPEPAPLPSAEELSFAGEIIAVEPGQSVTIRRRIALDADLYLNDHHFDPEISEWDPARAKLNVIPMTVSVEMLAEVASLLEPHRKVVGIRGAQVDRWIEVEEHATAPVVHIVAERDAASREIRAALHVLLDEATGRTGPAVARASFVFADEFPAPPAVERFEPRNSRQPSHTAAEMYSRHRMFHGPRFQGVIGLDRIGDDGLAATLEVLPTHDLFNGRTDAKFAFDPFLLDAAGQLVGYWPVEFFDEGYVLFPIRLQELTRYGEEPPTGSRITCHLRVKHVAFRELHADLDLIAPDGRLWMRLSGWQDWRFHWPRSFYDFWRFPNLGVAGAEIRMPPLPGLEDVEIRRMISEGEIKSVLWEKLWAYLICSRRELTRFNEMPANPRRTEWMAGRSAVKDAARVWLKKRFGRDLYPADVEIVPDHHGRPTVAGPCVQAVAQLPFISIAHKGPVGIGAAAGRPLGVDLEKIEPRDEAFAAAAFNGDERRMLDIAANGRDLPEWLTRAWAAKEAAGKAAGDGLAAGPQAAFIERIEAASGGFAIVIRTAESPSARRRYMVTTQRDSEFIIALAVEDENGRTA